MRVRSVIVFAGLALLAPRNAQAQRRHPRETAFGFSAITYRFEESDRVFTSPGEHLSGNVGFRFTKAYFGRGRLGWMLDTELYLGVAHRDLLGADLPNTIFGLQGFIGPVVALGPFQLYSLGGVNRTTVGKSDIINAPGYEVVQYIGSGGISTLWAQYLTALGQNAGNGDVIASVPRYSNVSPAAVFGMSWDLGGSSFGLRLSVDYIPIFMGPKRNNFEATFSLAG